MATLWQASVVAEGFAEVFDEFDPRLGTAVQTFEDRSTRTRDHADFVIANLDYRLDSASLLRGDSMGAAAGGDGLQSRRKSDLDSEAFSKILDQIYPAL